MAVQRKDPHRIECALEHRHAPLRQISGFSGRQLPFTNVLELTALPVVRDGDTVVRDSRQIADYPEALTCARAMSIAFAVLACDAIRIQDPGDSVYFAAGGRAGTSIESVSLRNRPIGSGASYVLARISQVILTQALHQPVWCTNFSPNTGQGPVALGSPRWP